MARNLMTRVQPGDPIRVKHVRIGHGRVDGLSIDRVYEGHIHEVSITTWTIASIRILDNNNRWYYVRLLKDNVLPEGWEYPKSKKKGFPANDLV